MAMGQMRTAMGMDQRKKNVGGEEMMMSGV
jgi:hypothetical protein